MSTIPSQIGKLSNLKHLHIGRNQLTGTIPASLASLDIHTLRLQRTKFHGKLLDFMDFWPNLKYIGIRETDITGTIPKSILNSTQLESFLVGPLVTGTIPKGISNLSNLKELWLTGSELVGEIPTDFAKMTKLGTSVVHMFPSRDYTSQSLTNQTHSSETFLWEYVTIQGSIPTSIGKASSLMQLGLAHTSVTGTLPTEIGNLSNLNTLALVRTTALAKKYTYSKVSFYFLLQLLRLVPVRC